MALSLKSAKHRRSHFSRDLPRLAAVVAIGGVIWITLWQLHPNLLLTNTITTGGDTGAHVALPEFLRTNLLSHGHLTGWYPGWYDGFPLYTYYFVFPDFLAALASYVIPYGVAFKFATVIGSLLMPICAYGLGRMFRLRAPLPSALAISTLPFLFDSSFTIDGGNLFSTLAGEYAFSLCLALSFLVLGLFARGIRTGKGSIITPVVMALCLGSHMIPYLYAGAGVAILILMSLLPDRLFVRDDTVLAEVTDRDDSWQARQRSLWWAIRTGVLGVGLSCWWLIPFVQGQGLANPMGYVNDTDFFAKLFPGADYWVVALAVIGVGIGLYKTSRFVVTFAILAAGSALTFILLPQGSLWNERVLPLWYISLYLLAGWAVGELTREVATAWRKRKIERYATSLLEDADHARPPVVPWLPGAVAGPLVILALALCVVVPPLAPSLVPPSALSKIGITVGANQVSSWASWNYSGYEAKPAYPEYQGVISTMKNVTARYGCGRAMWEYNANLDRFGTPMALMLLPYWTNGCVGSQEGLFFEASATTPYHFLTQSALSAQPSDPQVGLPYGGVDVAKGVQQLQILGVKYFMATSSSVTTQADSDPLLSKVASSGPWPANGSATTKTTWSVYLIHHSPMVEGLTHLPVVVPGIDATSGTWKDANVAWFGEPARWGVPLAASGPSSWPRGTSATTTSTAIVPTAVSNISSTTTSVSFDVNQIGKPVVVRVSYYPRWHVSGATGPYRISPNLMAVVPMQRHVELTYGADRSVNFGLVLSALSVIGLVLLVVGARRRRSSL